MFSFKKINLGVILGNYKNLLQIRSSACPISTSYHVKSVETKLGLPEKPKKPLTPYFRFMKETRPSVVANNPNASLIDIVRILASKWKTVDPDKKKKLENDYRNEQVIYIEERSKYESNLTAEEKEKIKNHKIEIALSKEKRETKKKLKELGKPKRPASAFLRFLSSDPIKKLHDKNLPYKDFQKLAADKWKALPAEERERLEKVVRNEIQKYRIEMSKWEEKMIRLGNIDVVRHEALIEAPPSKPRRRSTNTSTTSSTKSRKE